jgi:hypothetical protein
MAAASLGKLSDARPSNAARTFSGTESLNGLLVAPQRFTGAKQFFVARYLIVAHATATDADVRGISTITFALCASLMASMVPTFIRKNPE